MKRLITFLTSITLLLISGFMSSVFGNLTAGPDGHWIMFNGRLQALVGDSGTQCVLQNGNIDYRRWIDDVSEAGMNGIHLWSFVAPRQTPDGAVIEQRYGYVYPGLTPWPRHASGPPAADGRPRWDLKNFDEGDDPHSHYWPRLREICRLAKEKGLVVGISVFFGWPKHNTPKTPDWTFHPFNKLNGGHLVETNPLIHSVQQIASPGEEVLDLPWSDTWNDAMKTQWIWERFADKLIAETKPFGNAFFVFMDEHSYSEGNGGKHFAEFFKRRGAFWVDDQRQPRRELADGVMDGYGRGSNLHGLARKSFYRKPHRPWFELEVPPYTGAKVRHNLYAVLLGGGHFFHHNDERQETPTTGIMGYDPNVQDSRLDKVLERYTQLGVASRLLNSQVEQLQGMQPAEGVIIEGKGYCLARPGAEYAIYIMNGRRVVLDLGEPILQYQYRLVNPRTGEELQPHGEKVVGSRMHITLPDAEDWLIHLRLVP